jgi:hypothetical protein
MRGRIEMPVAVPWSAAAGRPNVRPGTAAGFWIWHEGDTVFLATTSRKKEGLPFGGTITAEGGTITNGKTIALEKEDGVQHPAPNQVTFHFRTHRHMDGIRFNVSGGRSLSFALRLNGAKTERIFVGAGQVQAHGDPVVFDATR